MYKKAGDYYVDLSRRFILKGDKEIDVEPMVFNVLVYLLENNDRYVTVEELHDKVWINKIVSDSAVRRTIVRLRYIFDDNNGESNYIKSLPRRGYRIICDISDDVPPNVKSKQRSKLSQLALLIALPIVIVAALVLGLNVNKTKEEYIGAVSASPQSPISHVSQLSDIYGQNDFPSLSSNNQFVVFSNKMEKSQFYKLLIREHNSEKIFQIVDMNADLIGATWIEDDTALVAMRLTSDNCELIRIDAPFNASDQDISVIGQCISGQPNINYLPVANQIIYSDSPSKFEPLILNQLDLETLSVKRITPPIATGIGDYHSAVSKNGELIAFVRNEKQTNVIFIESLSNGNILGSFESKEDVLSMFWTTNDQLVLLLKDKIQTFDETANLINTQAIEENIIELYPYNDEDQYLAVLQEPHVYLLKERSNPFLQTHSAEQIISKSQFPISFAYSPATNTIYYASWDGVNSNIFKQANGQIAHIHQVPRNVTILEVSRDEQDLIFLDENRFGLLNIETLNTQYLNKEYESVNSATFSEDGRSILLTRKESESWNLYRVNRENAQEEFIAKNAYNVLDTDTHFIISRFNREVFQLDKTTNQVSQIDKSISLYSNGSWQFSGEKLYYSEQMQDTIALRQLNTKSLEEKTEIIEQGNYVGNFSLNFNEQKIAYLYKPLTQTSIDLVNISNLE